MVVTNSPYKPSPLSFGSPRSPFRRPETPTSPSTVRANSPQTSPTRISSTGKSNWSPKTPVTPGAEERRSHQNAVLQPRDSNRAGSSDIGTTGRNFDTTDSLSKLPPAQVRELRDAFQILDRDGDGQVGREDVMEMLTNLGQNADASQYFPPGAPQTMSLPVFLRTMSSLLAPMSAPSELLSAFAAFDEDDAGQIDISDLRDALLHTAPEPGMNSSVLSSREVDRALNGYTGRRAFTKHGIGKKGDVFRYQDFVASISGGGGGTSGQGKANSDE
ncbi:MAG: hypothetical protein M1814_006415 [Vezdaea aestivalis]|nr:MAG: hypothetical protein M1814_006415 [Vezdaea aestivalis]